MEKYQNSKFIFVIGIGGSNLASKAIWNALTLHKTDTEKKIFFLESPDLREYEEIANLVQNEINDLEEFVFVVASKSGETKETLEAFNKTFEIFSNKFEVRLNERVVAISTKNSPLSQMAEEKNFTKIEWPAGVGGRFSAFTEPHTSILSIAGLNTYALIEGGKEMAKKCENESDENPAKDLASKIFKNYGSIKSPQANILDFFIFNSELEDLGKWCRQLTAESLGKENKKGEKVGITPTVSIGPTDLHSMLQLDLGGPKNRFTIFIRSLKEIENSINESAYEKTVKAYEKADLPFEKCEMSEINEREIGEFMALMIETTIELAKLLNVDPYDQPAVENYKKDLTN